jgi:hypothetical protein
LPAGGAAAARGAVFAGSATNAALAILRVGSSSLNCWAGGGLLALISLTKSDLHFHIPNFKLSQWLWDTSMTSNFLNCERFIIPLSSHTPQASTSPFRWRRCDGLKLNINSLRQFLYNNNLKGLSLYNNIMLWLKL